ncbi:MAG: hypothetical protein KF865_14585 [Bdellovibrionaceae bacterium]|nr:hypothetical protein [Pseudobdellovibrionaceae bacterium]
MRATLHTHAKKSGLRILRYQNVGNHLHLIIQLTHRSQYAFFVRSITGRIAQAMQIKWDHRPFTRIITWGRDFLGMTNYMLKNQLDAMGLPRTPERVVRLSQRLSPSFSGAKALLRNGDFTTKPSFPSVMGAMGQGRLF